MISRLGKAWLTAVTLVVLLAGCGVLTPAPSPTSTTTDAAGDVLVVDWQDYPANAGVDGFDLIGAPDRSGLEAPARSFISDLRTAIQRAAGFDLRPVEPEASWFTGRNWFPDGGNGYGGASMLTTVNCCSLRADRAPDIDRWQSVVDAASAVTRAAGFGPLRLEQDEEDLTDDFRDRYCTLPDGSCWSWVARAYDGYQWVDLTIQDAALDPTGDAARVAADESRPPASVELTYGATVVQTGRTAEYERALAPFRGLPQPNATTSD